MELTVLLVACLSCILMVQRARAVSIVYLTNSCNVTVQASSGGFIEPDSRLLYNNNIDCTTVLTTTKGSRFLLRFFRFNLEESINGACVDHLTVYDGLNRSVPLTETLCGRRQIADIASDSNSLTFDFVSDESGSTSGFEIFYSVFTNAPCTSEKFACNNSRCIDIALMCDSYNMCGDNSDETDCDVTLVIETGLSAAAIAGIIAGSLCLLLLVFGVIKAVIHKYQSKQLLNQLMEEMRKQPTTNEYSEKDFWGDNKPVEE